MKALIGAIFAFSILFTLQGCSDPGPGGKGQIRMTVVHHDELIPGAELYIKYGATTSPGTNLAIYDAMVVADSNGLAEFTDLNKGDYYIYGRGYDFSIQDSVFGGIPVNIEKKNEILDVVVPVTE